MTTKNGRVEIKHPLLDYKYNDYTVCSVAKGRRNEAVNRGVLGL